MSEEMGQEPTTPTGQEPKVEKFDAEYVKKLQAEVKELRREDIGYRHKAKELEAKVAEYEAAKLTETEKLQKEAADAKTQLEQLKAEARQARADAAIAQHAAASGIKVEVAKKMIDVQFDDAGNPTGVDTAFAQLLQDHPYLKVGFGGSSTNPQRQATLTMQDIQKMSPQEYLQRKDEVDKALAAMR